jgi:pimeloyl-ACP methyl ester carboxylesterase
MTPQAWKAQGRYFAYNGHQLFYRENKKAGAPWLVLIHGFPTASWDWHHLWVPLSQHFSLLAIDMLGFGFSDKPRHHDYTLMEQADIHEAIFAEKGIATCHILAHDYGDSVAQELLARHQERHGHGLEILSCCLLNGGIIPGLHRPVLVQKLLLSPVGSMLSLFLGKKALGRNFRKIFGPNTQPTATQIDHFWSLIEYQKGKYIFYRLIRYMPERTTHKERWVNILKTTKVPLLLINGPEDPISGRHMVARYQAIVPNPNVVRLEGIGHYPNVEAPEAVLEAYLTFLGVA